MDMLVKEMNPSVICVQLGVCPPAVVKVRTAILSSPVEKLEITALVLYMF